MPVLRVDSSFMIEVPEDSPWARGDLKVAVKSKLELLHGAEEIEVRLRRQDRTP